MLCFTGSVGLAVRSKQPKPSMNTTSSKENTQIPLLNANAAAVLSELGLSEEDGYPAQKSTVKPTKRPSLNAPKVFDHPGRASKRQTF